MTTTCIIQARTGSTRLPGKVLQPVAGRPMLRFMLDRLAGLAVDQVVVATSDLERDDPVADIAREAGVAVFRGDEADVLARFVGALDAYPADVVVRLTADCPLMDPRLVEAVLACRERTDADYATNTLPRSFPKGLDVEVMRAEVLRTAAAEATATDEREHVTPYIYRHPERFTLANLLGDAPLGTERWTVDTADDIAFIQQVADQLPDDRAPWGAIFERLGRRSEPGPGACVLRPAFVADADRLLAWRNDPESVRWSGSGAAVAEADHHAWFAAALTDAGRRILIGERDGVPVGMVRVDVDAGIGTVSIAVAPECRGQGIGFTLLTMLGPEMRGDQQTTELRALVHPDNAASRRIFQEAGFVEVGPSGEGAFLEYRCPRSAYPDAVPTGKASG